MPPFIWRKSYPHSLPHTVLFQNRRLHPVKQLLTDCTELRKPNIKCKLFFFSTSGTNYIIIFKLIYKMFVIRDYLSSIHDITIITKSNILYKYKIHTEYLNYVARQVKFKIWGKFKKVQKHVKSNTNGLSNRPGIWRRKLPLSTWQNYFKYSLQIGTLNLKILSLSTSVSLLPKCLDMASWL